jgi:hypothetical protein
MDDYIRSIVLDDFNNQRSRIAQGQSQDGTGTYFPNAANMYSLTWSMRLESNAAEKVKNCKWNDTTTNSTALTIGWSPYGYESDLGMRTQRIRNNDDI